MTTTAAIMTTTAIVTSVVVPFQQPHNQTRREFFPPRSLSQEIPLSSANLFLRFQATQHPKKHLS
jgi:hypothetical protein